MAYSKEYKQFLSGIKQKKIKQSEIIKRKKSVSKMKEKQFGKRITSKQRAARQRNIAIARRKRKRK